MRIFFSRNVRLSITIFLLLASALLLVATVVFSQKESLVYVIGLSISSSGLATTLIEIVAQVTEKVEILSNQRRFLRLFGHDGGTNGSGNIAIIIPAFALNNPGAENSSINLKQQAQKLVSQLHTKAAIKSDVTAASYLVSTFSKLGLPVPQIRWDEEMSFGDDQVTKTYVVVGLSNNIIEITKESSEKYFSISQTLDNRGNLSNISIRVGLFDSANQLVDEKRWIKNSVTLDPRRDYLPEDGVDYALFAKLRVNGKMVIICGGCTEFGTRDIGIYISKQWKKIYFNLVNEKGSRITANDAFAVLFQLPVAIQQSEDISIVHRCIKKLHTGTS